MYFECVSVKSLVTGFARFAVGPNTYSMLQFWGTVAVIDNILHPNQGRTGPPGCLALAWWAGWSAGLVGRHVKCCRGSGTEGAREPLAREGVLYSDKLFALLLDDALLKCDVTEVVLFSVVAFKTLKGSVATHLRFGGMFSESTVTTFLPILTVKKVWNLVNIWRSYKAYKKCAKFLGHPVGPHAASQTARPNVERMRGPECTSPFWYAACRRL